MTIRNGLEHLVRRRDHTNKQLFNLFEHAGLVDQILPNSSTGKQTANFVDSDYLGLSKHPQVVKYACMGARRLGISTGMPRLLGRDELSDILETELARFVGQEKAAIFSSTTHIAFDVLPLLAGNHGMIFMDDWAYPISLEGADVAVRQGAKMMRFSHNDPFALGKMLRSYERIRDKVIVCDGVYSAGGGRAALKEFSFLAEKYGAVIYLDDAHGFGILGTEPQKHPPYGLGGGGTSLFEGVPPGNLVYVASLSKALGVPLAFAAGPAKFVEYLIRISKSFVHSSQPALPIVAAALGALQVNKAEGDRLRKRLAQHVKQFIQRFHQIRIPIAENGCFPIQSIHFPLSNDAWQAGARLRRNGVWSLLQISPRDFPTGGALRFVISAKHSEAEIQRLHELSHLFRRSQIGEADFGWR